MSSTEWLSGTDGLRIDVKLFLSPVTKIVLESKYLFYTIGRKVEFRSTNFGVRVLQLIDYNKSILFSRKISNCVVVMN